MAACGQDPVLLRDEDNIHAVAVVAHHQGLEHHLSQTCSSTTEQARIGTTVIQFSHHHHHIHAM